jgi:streptogramin lyase
MKIAYLLAVSAIASTLLTGCGSISVTPVTPQVTGFGGRVHGGINPVVGATVQLWEVGSTGYGSAPTPLGSSVLTDSNGGFYLGNSGIVCPASAPEIYLTATGGNPGYPTATNNDGLYLMTVIGPCNSTYINSSSFWSVNEVSTVASVYALAQFINPANGNIGAYGNAGGTYNISGLTNAFTLAATLYNVATGTANTTNPGATSVIPQAEINTLANIITPCANDTSHTGNNCAALSTALGSNAPTVINSLNATLAIATHPGSNVAALYGLRLGNPAFQPALSAQPDDFTLAVGYHTNANAPSSLAIDATGNVWIADYNNGNSSHLIELGPQGVPASGSPFSNQTAGISTVALDQSGNIWAAGLNTSSITEYNSSGAYNFSVTPSAAPSSAIAIDSAGAVWTTNSSANTLSLYSPLLGQTGTFSAASGDLGSPVSLAFDSSGNLWVANSAIPVISEFNASGVVFNTTDTSLSELTSVAIDAANNVWSGSYHGVEKVVGDTPTAYASTPNNAVAFDGASNLWSASSANVVYEYSDSGALLSPSAGYKYTALNTPTGIGVDASGNVWVVNKIHTLIGATYVNAVQFVGAATPAVTPLASALTSAQIAQPAGTPVPVTIASNALPYYTSGASFTAKLKAKGGNSGSFTWSLVSGALPTGMSLAANGLLTGIPTGASPSTFTVQAADSGLPSNYATQALTLTPAPSNFPFTFYDLDLDNFFTVKLSGMKGSSTSTTGGVSQWAAIGSLAFDGGGNVSGQMDYNDSSSGSASTLSVTGTYTIGSDGRGTLFLSPSPLPAQLAFSVANQGQNIYFTEFDFTNSTSTTTGLATGFGKVATPASFTSSTIAQTFVFGADGESPCSTCNGAVTPYGPIATAGRFINAGGNSTGQEDAGAMDAAYSGVTLSGSYTAPDSYHGRGTLTLTPTGTLFPAPPTHYTYYVVNSGEILLLSSDGHATTSLLSGDALVQSQTFNSNPNLNVGLLNGSYVVTQNGTATGDGVSVYPHATTTSLFFAQFDGVGDTTAYLDQNMAGFIAALQSEGSPAYSTDGSGRLTFTGASIVIYVATPAFASGIPQGFGISAASGQNPGLLTLYKQSVSSPSCASANGTYSFGSPRPTTSEGTSSGVFTLSGTAATYTVDNSNGVLSTGNLTATCSSVVVTTPGRLTFTGAAFNGGSGTQTSVAYILSPTSMVLINETPNKYDQAITFLQKQ